MLASMNGHFNVVDILLKLNPRTDLQDNVSSIEIIMNFAATYHCELFTIVDTLWFALVGGHDRVTLRSRSQTRRYSGWSTIKTWHTGEFAQ